MLLRRIRKDDKHRKSVTSDGETVLEISGQIQTQVRKRGGTFGPHLRL